ncbi:MAG: hypothetical protein RL017_898 [Pseudomonadota bacterium]|jgi:hydroxyethylthiazole kinase-like uncharacterized protein yjeF|nr:NAD(P)H-hydrate dehydratase [Burkholderiales bacterium]
MVKTFLNISQIRQIEIEALTKYKLDLMELAANCIVKFVKSKYFYDAKVLVLIGGGNNGGDGTLAAVKLKKLGYNPTIYKITNKLNPNTEMLLNEYIALEGNISNRLPLNLNTYDLIIDAMLGIGINAPLDNKLIKIINTVNNSNCCKLAIDTPTGLDPFNAKVYGSAIKANYTITFIGDKAGFYTGGGVDLVGQLIVEPLINLLDFQEHKSVGHEVRANDLIYIDYSKLVRRQNNTNKGTYGSVLIIGGNSGMHGSICLAGRAAMLMGSGKVILASLDEKFNSNIFMPELMTISLKDAIKNLNDYSAVVIGPGFGTKIKSIKLLTKIIEQRPQSKLIFDADALNIIALDKQLQELFRLLPNKIITPHPGEASRLLNITVEMVNQDRFNCLKLLATQYNAACLLKGAGSLIDNLNGVYVNLTGNAALANAGQGDTLCGMIASLIAQGLDLSAALRLAVYIHGKAGDNLAKTIGLNGVLASEIGLMARTILNKLLYSNLK